MRMTNDKDTTEEYRDGSVSEIFDQFEYSVQQMDENEYCKASDEILRQYRVKSILNDEVESTNSLIKSFQSKEMNQDMKDRQAKDIEEAFFEPNYLRAELADLVPNTSSRLFLLRKYITTNIVELQCRKRYKAIVIASALHDAKMGETNEQWALRVASDVQLVSATLALRKQRNKDLVLRKRYEYDHNRAKAILKADSLALKTAWP